MANNPKENGDKINQLLTAWETISPTKSFAGMTLDQFKAVVQPSLNARAELVTLNHQTVAAQDRRETAGRMSMEAILRVVAGVKADPTEGDDSALYETMGYRRRSERSSGLHRGGPDAAPETPPPAA